MGYPEDKMNFQGFFHRDFVKARILIFSGLDIKLSEFFQSLKFSDPYPWGIPNFGIFNNLPIYKILSFGTYSSREESSASVS